MPNASKVKPNTIHPIGPTISMMKPTIPNTIMNELTKYGISCTVFLTIYTELNILFSSRPWLICSGK